MKFKISIILFLLAGAFSSCREELLSPIPQTSISDAVAFETPERTLAAVNGMYAGAKAGQIYAGRYLVYQDVRAEEFINETANGVTNLQTWNFTLTSGTNEVQNLWGAAYAAINRINVVLDGLERSPVADALKNQYRGEARFLRALLYHNLVTLYARPYTDGNGSKPGVVIYTEPQISSGENKKERSTVGEVYTLILEDLNFAETNLPSTYGTQYLNVTRAHKNSAIALKTRVYLHMGKYAEVITEGNKIVSATAPFTASSGVQHRLESSVTSVFGTGAQTLENVLSFPFTSLDLPGTQNSLNSYYSPGSSTACATCSGTGEYSLNLGANGIAADAGWTSTDARRTNFVQLVGTKTYLRKWNDNVNFVQGIRYAEVMLNLAEALARTTAMDARAIALVNAVRKRSDASTTLAPASQTESINMILKERRIELLGEGFRSRDLARLMLPIPSKGTVAALAPTDAQYIWPIPLSELVVNTIIDQNPGY
jgi:starch-binding outer membrane protein, SusD/RagB family